MSSRDPREERGTFRGAFRVPLANLNKTPTAKQPQKKQESTQNLLFFPRINTQIIVSFLRIHTQIIVSFLRIHTQIIACFTLIYTQILI